MRTTAASGTPAAWKCQISRMQQKLCMSDHARPWTRHMQPSAETERVKAILDFVVMEKVGPSALNMSKASLQAQLRDVYCDVSQNPDYRRWTNQQGFMGCLLTTSRLYSYLRDSSLLPFEHLRLQGHRRDLVIPSSVPQGSVRALAGEGMFLPSLGSIIWALYLTKGLP